MSRLDQKTASRRRSNGLISRWIDELAMLLPQEQKRKPWRALLLSADDGLQVYLRDGKGNPRHVGLLKADGDSEFEKKRDKRRLLRLAKQPDGLVLRLAKDDTISKTITIPAGAKDVMAPIIGNQIELISPWPSDKALYDWQANAGQKGDHLSVDVVVAGKAIVERLMQLAAGHGLKPEIADAAEGPDGDTALNFLRRRQDEPVRGRGLVKMALLLMTIGALTAGSVGSLQVFEKREMLAWAEQSAELATRRARAALTVTGKAARLEARYQLASDEKYRQLPAVVILEALSRTLPDGTWITRLETVNNTIRLGGFSSDAAGLVGIIERAPFFTNARLAAPVTPAGGRQQFVIDARAAENLDLNSLLKSARTRRLARPRAQRRGSER